MAQLPPILSLLGRTVSQCVLLTVIYTIIGIASLQMIESPSSIGSPIWPGAGIALAALYLWGRQLWPGVLLGAMLVQIIVGYDRDHEITQTTKTFAAVMGLGATLQAVIGVWLMRKIIGKEIPALKSRDIWTYVLLVGPGINLFHATWSVGILWQLGTVNASTALSSWYTWWLGDSIGTLIVFTALMTVWGKPPEIWRPRRVSVAITLFFLFASLVGYFSIVRNVERYRISNNLTYLVPLAHYSLKGWFENASVAMKSWRGRYEDTLNDPQWEKTKNFRDGFLKYHDTVYGLGLAVLVKESEREKFEQTLPRIASPARSITERDSRDVLVSAPNREEYMSVLSYTTRTSIDVSVLGYDLASNSAQREAIEHAVRTNTFVACNQSAPFQPSDRRVMLVVMPFYHKMKPLDTPEERLAALQGIAFVLYDIDTILARAIRSQFFPTKHLSVSLHENLAPTTTTDKSELRWSRNTADLTLPVVVGSQPMNATYKIETEYLHRDFGHYLDLMRFFWLLITILIVAVQLLISGRIFVVEGEVQQRTTDLRNEISERMRVESQLRVVQASLEEAETQARLGSWEYDIHANSSWCSSEHYRIVGQAPADGPPRMETMFAFAHPEDRQKCYSARDRVLQTGVSESLEVRSNPDLGEMRYFNSTMRLLNDSEGRPTRLAGTLQDITQRKLLENDLIRARDDLERRVQARTRELVLTNDALRSEMQEREKIEQQFRQAQKMEILGQLAGGIAHDFNNLLTVICGYAEILCANSKLDKTSREWANEIFNTGNRASLLTRQLLAFSRKHVFEPKVIDINDTVRNIEKLSLRLVGENIRFQIQLDNGALCVRGDPSQIEQILLNLAVNARDAMPRGGSITVTTASIHVNPSELKLHPVGKQGNYVLLSVADTGTGMTPEVQAQIFEPFFTTKGPGKGTGLGLATVMGIVKQSGGAIVVDSEIGKGTTFRIYLPQQFAEVTDSPSITSNELISGNETILIAEDEDCVRLLARQILEGCGYKVLDASDGLMAIQMAKEHDGPIDLLISDIVMPNLCCRELLSSIRALRPELKVLLFSGYADDDSLRDDILAEDYPFLNKPFTANQLTNKVRSVISQKSR